LLEPFLVPEEQREIEWMRRKREKRSASRTDETLKSEEPLQ
jgi:hypothetical protein